MDRERNSDRERLSGVHRSEQSSESRVNEEFVEWLKTKGPTYLLIVVLMLLGYLWWVRWADSRDAREAQAWHSLQEAEISGLPSSFEHVAEQYGTVASVGILARLRGAQVLMNAVQRGVPVGTEEDARDPVTLSDDERENYLARAERMYREVLGMAGERRSELAIFAVKAHNGLAAVAEARGDRETATSHFEQAAARAEGVYPHLAAQARRRAETTDIAETIVGLPTQEERERLFSPDLLDDRTPVPVDSAFRDLLMQ